MRIDALCSMKIQVTRQKDYANPPRPIEELGVTHDMSTLSPARYIVIDKQLFMLAVIQYGIEFVEVTECIDEID